MLIRSPTVDTRVSSAVWPLNRAAANTGDGISAFRPSGADPDVDLLGYVVIVCDFLRNRHTVRPQRLLRSVFAPTAHRVLI